MDKIALAIKTPFDKISGYQPLILTKGVFLALYQMMLVKINLRVIGDSASILESLGADINNYKTDNRFNIIIQGNVNLFPKISSKIEFHIRPKATNENSIFTVIEKILLEEPFGLIQKVYTKF